MTQKTQFSMFRS